MSSRSVFCAALMAVFAAVPTSSQELSRLPDLIDRVAPSVVSITVVPSDAKDPKTAPKKQAPAKQTGKDGQSKETKKRQPTTASGMILSPDGFIVTASFVVDKSGPITVVLADGTRLPAKIVGLDSRSSIALLKVDSKKPLPAVSLGDSNRVRRGQPVIAIGSPFGLGGTVSLGIISATDRGIDTGPYEFLQTDAAINRGHSGGPLFDFDGGVVGMSSAIFSPTDGNVGIAFAVPSNLVRDVAQKLKQSGYVERGWLGAKIQNVTEDIAHSLGLEKASGAMISEILNDGPAAGSGLAPGDVVVSIDGRTIVDSRHFARTVGEYAPDTDIELGVNRKGKSNKVRIKLGKFPGAAPTQPETPPSPGTAAAKFGLSLEPAPAAKPKDEPKTTKTEADNENSSISWASMETEKTAPENPVGTEPEPNDEPKNLSCKKFVPAIGRSLTVPCE